MVATKTKIVVGVDGSDSSKEALAWAIRQAKLSGAQVEAVTSWEYPTNYGWAMPIPEDMDFAADAQTILDNAVAEVVAGDKGPIPEITKTVVEGHPAIALKSLARDAALLVVGSRGHGAFTGMLLGSVSEHLATHSPCPVLILRDHAKAEHST